MHHTRNAKKMLYKSWTISKGLFNRMFSSVQDAPVCIELDRQDICI